MKTREEMIAFEMNYCQHYKCERANITCKAGVDIDKLTKVDVHRGEGKTWKVGPCIGGHHLANPTEHCPHWVRRNREMGEKRADDIEQCLARMDKVMPVVSEWRQKKAPFSGQHGVIECPVCKGRLHLAQASYNGHVHGHCETKDCVSWIE